MWIDADHQRQQRRGAEIAGCSLLDQRGERRRGEQRDDRHGPDGELSRRAEQGVDDHRDRRGVEADLGREPGEQGVGHRLGDEHRPDREARHEIAPEVSAAVVGPPRQDREQLSKRVHRCEYTYN